jgi:hypothetical protein
MDFNSLIDQFLQKHSQGINSLISKYFDGTTQSLEKVLRQELHLTCQDYFSKSDSKIENLFPLLFYTTNSICKKISSSQTANKSNLICPGCLFLGTTHVVTEHNLLCSCSQCAQKVSQTFDPKMKHFFQVFAKHHKIGFRCHECQRFIPQSHINGTNISCPYLDCSFVGASDSLHRMHHPKTKNKIDFSIIDGILPEKIEEKSIRHLKDIIESQKNNSPYKSYGSTLHHKYLCYQAYANILDKYPEQLTNYLLNNSRTGGFQSKLFQEYIRLLEQSLPFSIKKENKYHVISSLLDPNLNLFDGISEFTATVNQKLEIKNNTQEFYIGGRKGSIAEPFYMGKILSIIDKNTSQCYMENIIEYSFSTIKLKNIKPETVVIVSHLRIPPHYQMNGMVYINRIRKSIIDEAKK